MDMMSHNIPLEHKLKALGYVYCEPHGEWTHPHLLTTNGGVIPVRGWDDSFILDLEKQFDEQRIEDKLEQIEILDGSSKHLYDLP
jgi:hypothetical protein